MAMSARGCANTSEKILASLHWSSTRWASPCERVSGIENSMNLHWGVQSIT